MMSTPTQTHKFLMVISGAGLGNILLPFISGIIFTWETGRRLMVNDARNFHGYVLLSELFDLQDTDIVEIQYQDLKKFLSQNGVSQIQYYVPTCGDITSRQWTWLGDHLQNACGIDLPINYLGDDSVIPSDDSEFILSYTMGNFMLSVTPATMSYDTGCSINRQNFKRAFQSLKVREELRHAVDEFIKRNNVDHNTFGIHFRLTDVKDQYRHRADVERIKAKVRALISRNPRIKFFVCSDEAELEAEFVAEFGGDEGRMITKTKTHYPDYQEGTMLRDKETILQAFIDVMILSSTTMSRELSNGSYNHQGHYCAGTFNTLAKTLSRDVRYLTGGLRDLLPSLAVSGSPALETGHCFLMSLPEYTLVGDTADESCRSRLVLYEDDRPLGPAHSLHEDIRHLGGGRYSHWHGNIYFSSSDHSDPRTNGREYKIVLHD